MLPALETGSPASAVAFSPDGTALATACVDGTVRLWNPNTGQLVGEPLTGHTGPVDAVAFSPDGAILVTVSHRDSIAPLWVARFR
ncbi:WD40 repeat domain-containing protein [Streptomyces sp. NPDC054945]